MSGQTSGYAGTASGWTNPGNATGGDNGASATTQTHHATLTLRDFNLNVPPGSVIDGIEVKVNAWILNTGDSGDCQLEARLSWDGGSNWTSRKTVTLGTNQNDVVTFGSSSDQWGRSNAWGPSNFTNANFRVELRANDDGSDCDTSGSTRDTWHVDWVQVTVYYRRINSYQTGNPTFTGNVCREADFILLLDRSSSINETEMAAMKSALTGFISAYDTASSGLGMYSVTRFDVDAAHLTSGFVAASPAISAINGISGRGPRTDIE